MEIERRREVEERYADAQDGPGAVAGGGGDWKEAEGTSGGRVKRGRSPDDEGDHLRMVRTYIRRLFDHRINIRALQGHRIRTDDDIDAERM
jgi:nuclear cap-binding protein subunit 2